MFEMGCPWTCPVRVPGTKKSFTQTSSVSISSRAMSVDRLKSVENFERKEPAGRNNNGRESELFQQLQVTAFILGRAGGFLNIFKKLAKIFFFGGIQSGEANPNSSGRAASDHPVQRETLYPDLTACDPESNFNFGASGDEGRGLHLASAQTGVGEIAPDGRTRVIDTHLHRHKTFDSGMPPSILSPVRAEDIGFKRRS